jgi:hypothetical protein
MIIFVQNAEDIVILMVIVQYVKEDKENGI